MHGPEQMLSTLDDCWREARPPSAAWAQYRCRLRHLCERHSILYDISSELILPLIAAMAFANIVRR